MEIYSALPTPFNEDLEVDYARFAELITNQLSQGVDGFVVGGTTGEKSTLTDEEFFNLCMTAIKKVPNDFPLYLNVGTNCTAKTLEMIERLDGYKFKGYMIVVPYYSLPSLKGIYQHIKMICESTKKAIILYHIPKRTGITLSPNFIKKCSKIGNLAIIKDCRSNYSDLLKIANLPKIRLFLGNDSDYLFGAANNLSGIISVISNIDLPLMQRLRQRNDKKDIQLYERYLKQLVKDPNPVGLKKMLRARGFDIGTVRLPLVE